MVGVFLYFFEQEKTQVLVNWDLLQSALPASKLKCQRFKVQGIFRCYILIKKWCEICLFVYGFQMIKDKHMAFLLPLLLPIFTAGLPSKPTNLKKKKKDPGAVTTNQQVLTQTVVYLSTCHSYSTAYGYGSIKVNFRFFW